MKNGGQTEKGLVFHFIFTHFPFPHLDYLVFTYNCFLPWIFLSDFTFFFPLFQPSLFLSLLRTLD